MRIAIICFLFLGLSLCHVYAQSEGYVTEGDNAYSIGHYNIAAKKYKAALAIMNKDNISKGSEKYLTLEKKIYKSEEKEKLYNRAESRFKVGTEDGYKDAKNLFQQLLNQNKTDAIAQRRIKDCSEKQAAIITLRGQKQEKQKEEKILWDSISVLRSKDAYAYYLIRYPQGVFNKQAKEEIESIEEESLWQKAVGNATLEAYQEYLSLSKKLKYKIEADLIVCRKKDDLNWRKITEKGDINAIKEYVSNFSNSQCKQYLNEGLLLVRQDELSPYFNTAKQYYVQKRYGMAIAQYDEIKKQIHLTEEAHIIYADCKAEISYAIIKKSKKNDDLEIFVQNYSNSRHYSEIANNLAMIYADKLTKNSTQEDCDKALNLASDSKTKKYVEKKIKKIKK